MDTTHLQKPVPQTLVEQSRGCIAKLINKAEFEAACSCLKAMFAAVRYVKRHTQGLYKTPKSCIIASELEGFTKRLTLSSKETVVSSWFEDHGGTVSTSLWNSLRLLAVYLCSHAMAKGTVFISFGLSCEKDKVIFLVTSSVATLHKPGDDDILLQMALGEVHRQGGRIKTDRIGRKKRVYRLAVTVDNNTGV